MPYRYTEEDLANIKAKQANDLAKFQRNSGRGLPERTVEEMEDADGLARDEHGEVIPPKPSIRRRAASEAPIATEEEECVSLIQWAAVMRFRSAPLTEVLFHIPNGAYLGADAKTRAITMGKLKAMGAQPGVFDYLLAVPIFKIESAGLWIEMKRRRGGTVSADQKTFRLRMKALGYQTAVCLGWEEAAKEIQAYVKRANVK